MPTTDRSSALWIRKQKGKVLLTLFKPPVDYTVYQDRLFAKDTIQMPAMDTDLLFFGGFTELALPGTLLGDFWGWYNDGWHEQTPYSSSLKPLPRFSHSATSDTRTGDLYVFGGFTTFQTIEGTTTVNSVNDMWRWTFATHNWDLIQAAISDDDMTDNHITNQPNSREAGTMTYDASRNELVLFGGYKEGNDYLNDTWVYTINTQSWTRLQVADSDISNSLVQPIARLGHAAVFNTDEGHVFMFGGSVPSQFGGIIRDSWIWSGESGTWSQVPDASGGLGPSHPTARYGHMMIYDSVLREIVLFGGNLGTGSGYGNDVWTWSVGNGWTRIQEIITDDPTIPPPRSGGVFLYSRALNAAILFGGSNGSAILNDTWKLTRTNSAITWVRVSDGQGQPPGRNMIDL